MINKKNILILLTLLITYFCCNKIIRIMPVGYLLYNMFQFTFIFIMVYRFPAFYLIFIIVIYEKFFQTIPVWIQPWKFMDYTIILVSMGIIVQLIKNRFSLKLGTNNYYFRFILYIFLVIFSCIFIGSYLVFNQPVNSLIFRARPYFLYLIFLYLCLAKFNINQLINILHS